nr:alcohol dehydrogenase catalytic domain-containing protein [Candidatus Njordarchaeota archaeon]
MKAAFLKGPKKMTVKDTDDPKPKPDHVVVKVKYCGICGSDLHAYETGMYSGIMGHEFSGDVSSIGESVKGWKIGERVTANPNIGCGSCYYCKRGETNLCMKLTAIGLTAPGAFAEYVPVRADLLRRLGSMSYEEGTLVEPLGTLVRTAKYSVKPGDSVLVMGAGPIGLCALLCAKKYGARNVFVTEVSQVRAQAATKLGADEVFNPNEVKINQKMIELTAGIGPDVVIECIGKPDTIRGAQNIVRKGGTVMIVGLPTVDVPTNYMGMSVHETAMKAIYAYSIEDFEQAAQLIERKQVNVVPIVSSKIGLSEIVERGFDELLKPEKNHIKILVDPQR